MWSEAASSEGVLHKSERVCQLCIAFWRVVPSYEGYETVSTMAFFEDMGRCLCGQAILLESKHRAELPQLTIASSAWE